MCLNPAIGNNQYVFRSDNFELKLSADYPQEFVDETLFITNNDMFVTTPDDLTDTAQNFASDAQEVKLRLIKWIANPFMFNDEETNFLESNITDFSILNTEWPEVEKRLLQFLSR